MKSTTPKPKHSPLPWKVNHRQHGQVFIGSDDMPVAVTSRGIGKGNEDEAMVEADAALIVRAVNAHEALVSLVSRALDRFTDNDMMPPNSELRQWIDDAQKALSQEGA